MKTKHFIGLILVLVGTNLFTFAASRYWTTQHVLIRAQKRMDAALKKIGHEELIYPPVKYPPVRKPDASLFLAVTAAGGMYYWWNDSIIYWLAGVLLVLGGIGFMFYEPQKKPAS